MGKRIRKFGPRSLEKARKYVNEHPKRQRYILRYLAWPRPLLLGVQQRNNSTFGTAGYADHIQPGGAR
jgi:hypothetical protein